MKELTPQILAMYLGCEIIDREGHRGTLQEVNANGYFTYEVGGDDIISAIGAGDTLVLRRLSSMTDEEAQQLLAILFYDAMNPDDRVTADEIDVALHPNDGALMVDGDMAVVVELSCRCFEGQLGVTLNGTLVLWNEEGKIERTDNVNKAVNFLRSKSFDCDELIDAELAQEKI